MDWKPCMYTFKMPDGLKADGLVSPPLWALVDHLVATICYLYKLDYKPTGGVEDLEWTLRFLNSLKPSCGAMKHIEILQSKLHMTINTTFRSPSVLFNYYENQESNKRGSIAPEIQKSNTTLQKNNGEEKEDTLSVPITLKDILGHQPQDIRIRVGKTEKKSSCESKNIQASICRLVRSGSCYQCSNATQTNQDNDKVLSKEEINEYLKNLLQHQNSIITTEQKNLELLNEIINKMDSIK